MSHDRLPDYIAHMKQAAADACGFVDGMNKEQFEQDKRTQQAVIMSLIIIGEAATKIMDGDPQFVVSNSQVPWSSMRGMRNRMAHGYFDTDLGIVWDTVRTALPELLERLSDVRFD